MVLPGCELFAHAVPARGLPAGSLSPRYYTLLCNVRYWYSVRRSPGTAWHSVGRYPDWALTLPQGAMRRAVLTQRMLVPGCGQDGDVCYPGQDESRTGAMPCPVLA
eukprot:3940643-Rhodomonas_salina.9